MQWALTYGPLAPSFVHMLLAASWFHAPSFHSQSVQDCVLSDSAIAVLPFTSCLTSLFGAIIHARHVVAKVAALRAMFVHEHRVFVAFPVFGPIFAVSVMIYATRWKWQRFAVTRLARFSGWDTVGLVETLVNWIVPCAPGVDANTHVLQLFRNLIPWCINWIQLRILPARSKKLKKYASTTLPQTRDALWRARNLK